MDEKKEKSEFAKIMEQTTRTLSNEIENKEGKGFILLGADSDEQAGNTQSVIAIAGHGKQIIEVLAQFIINPQTKSLFEGAMKVAAAKHLRDSLKEVVG